MVKTSILLQREVNKIKLNQTCAKYRQECHVDLISLAYVLTIYCYTVHFLRVLSSSNT